MQNKLYFLDENERSRILNLHENRTNKKYLVNDVISEIESFIWGVSKDEKILFTKTKIFFMEGETPKSLEYNLESLPHLLNVLKKEYDKKLTEGNINLVKYFSIPRKFLSEITKSLDSDIHKKILKEWDDKFNNNFRLLNENVELITESLKTKELWDEVIVLSEQFWDYLGRGAKALGNAVWSGAKAVGGAIVKGAKAVGGAILSGISSAAKSIILPILKQGVLPFLRWIRRNLNTYMGMIVDVVASLFPTVVVLRIIWGLIVMMDIYEITFNDYDPKDPERSQAPFMFLITDIISLIFTSAVGMTAKVGLKAAMKTGVASGPTKKILAKLIDSLPKLRGFLDNAKAFIVKVFGQNAGKFMSSVFNGIDTIISKLVKFIETTFNFKAGVQAIKQTGKELVTKQGVKKLVGGAVGGYLLADLANYLTSGKTLKRGAKGDLVKSVQSALIEVTKDYPQVNFNGPIDGDFGENTEMAVKKVQELIKIPVTGVVDSQLSLPLNLNI